MSAAKRAPSGPEIEVVAKATRRRVTPDYKRKIVREADGCKTPGAIGALLRREGLSSSHLATWRAARERGELGAGGQSDLKPWSRSKKSCGAAEDRRRTPSHPHSDGDRG